MLCYRNLPSLPNASFWFSELPCPALRFLPCEDSSQDPDSVKAPVCNVKCHRWAVLCHFPCVSVTAQATGSASERALHEAGDPRREAGLIHSGRRSCYHWLSNQLLVFLFARKMGTSNREFFIHVVTSLLSLWF